MLFEILGCGLLLATAYGIFSSTPQPEWTRSKRGSDPAAETDQAPHIGEPIQRAPAPSPPRPRPPARPLRGTLTVVDDRGNLVLEPEGTIFLRVELPDASSETHALTVAKGTFQVDVPIGSFVGAETATIEGRYAAVALPRTPLPESGTIAAQARIASVVEVNVEDAETSVPLRGITLLAGSGPPNHDLRPRSALDSLDPLGIAQDSPLRLAPDLPALDAWVDAPGYALARLRCSPQRDGSQRVRLQHPATMTITFSRELPTRAPVRLRIFESDPSDSTVFPRECFDAPLLDTKPLALDRLRPGTFLVRIAGSGSLPPILCERIVTLRPNETHELALDPRDEPPLHLTGTLTIRSGWDPLPPTLRCFARPSPLDSWQSVVDLPLVAMQQRDATSYRFQVDAPRADLRFEWLDSGFAFVVERREIELPIDRIVPAAAWLELRFVDESGRPIEVERVRLRSSDAADAFVLANAFERAEWRGYRARLPAGQITIELDDPNLRFADGTKAQSLLAPSGTTTHDFQVETIGR